MTNCQSEPKQKQKSSAYYHGLEAADARGIAHGLPRVSVSRVTLPWNPGPPEKFCDLRQAPKSLSNLLPPKSWEAESGGSHVWSQSGLCSRFLATVCQTDRNHLNWQWHQSQCPAYTYLFLEKHSSALIFKVNIMNSPVCFPGLTWRRSGRA